MTQERKLDVFQTLSNIDRKNIDFYSTLSPEEQKGFLAFVVMRWLSGTTDPKQLIFINELVNKHCFSLQKHPDLLYKLMTICGSGKTKRYLWLKGPGKRKSHLSTVIDVIREEYSYNSREAIDALPLLTDDDIVALAEKQGKQKEEVMKIKQELKTRHDNKS